MLWFAALALVAAVVESTPSSLLRITTSSPTSSESPVVESTPSSLLRTTTSSPPSSESPWGMAAMPSQVYERTANQAQYGKREYPTQEDAGSWDDLTEPDVARGGDVGFSVTGESMEADLPIEERMPSEESRRR